MSVNMKSVESIRTSAKEIIEESAKGFSVSKDAPFAIVEKVSAVRWVVENVHAGMEFSVEIQQEFVEKLRATGVERGLITPSVAARAAWSAAFTALEPVGLTALIAPQIALEVF